MPSAWSTMCSATSAGRSTRSSRSRSIDVPSRGSRPMLVPLRRCPHPGRRSASSGRARVRMKIGWADDQSRIESRKSSNPASAHWRSSITMTTGWVSVRRSKSNRHPAKRSSRARSASAAPSSCATRGSMKSRSSGAGTSSSRPRAQLGAHHVVRVLLADAEALAHDLDEGPVRDAVAVGEALAAVPQDVQGQAVGVLVELPGQPRLADTGWTHDRHAGARRAAPWRCGRAP